ncbi:MAG: PRC-barrel domain-containing protein [Gammaproteobacteria bacterium]
MKRTLFGAAFSTIVIALASANMALAQDAGDQLPMAGEGAAGMTGEQAMAPSMANSYLASNLIGKDVKDAQGQTLGSLDSLVINASGTVTYGIVKEEGGMAKSYAVPWSRFQVDSGSEMTLNVDKPQLSSEFSAFEPSQVQSGPKSEPGSEPGVKEHDNPDGTSMGNEPGSE